MKSKMAYASVRERYNNAKSVRKSLYSDGTVFYSSLARFHYYDVCVWFFSPLFFFPPTTFLPDIQSSGFQA